MIAGRSLVQVISGGKIIFSLSKSVKSFQSVIPNSLDVLVPAPKHKDLNKNSMDEYKMSKYFLKIVGIEKKSLRSKLRKVEILANEITPFFSDFMARNSNSQAGTPIFFIFLNSTGFSASITL